MGDSFNVAQLVHLRAEMAFGVSKADHCLTSKIFWTLSIEKTLWVSILVLWIQNSIISSWLHSTICDLASFPLGFMSLVFYGFIASFQWWFQFLSWLQRHPTVAKWTLYMSSIQKISKVTLKLAKLVNICRWKNMLKWLHDVFSPFPLKFSNTLRSYKLQCLQIRAKITWPILTKLSGLPGY